VQLVWVFESVAVYLYGCLKVLLCLYFAFLVLSGFFTVDVPFFTHDNLPGNHKRSQGRLRGHAPESF